MGRYSELVNYKHRLKKMTMIYETLQQQQHFNLCFVCNSWARSIQYEPVIKKLSEYLLMMEEENSSKLRETFEKTLKDLNEKKSLYDNW